MLKRTMIDRLTRARAPRARQREEKKGAGNWLETEYPYIMVIMAIFSSVCSSPCDEGALEVFMIRLYAYHEFYIVNFH